uniref:Putative pectate lyase n=1 Tax=viral metagenome TaxID=1070528 RepID=A0A6H1Z9D9_9ZZZZ
MRAILVLILLLLSSPAWAATYYVRIDGHDTNCNGTADASAASAPNCAWLTIGKAESTVSGSNTIIIGNGTYAEQLTIDISGTDANNLLTFEAQNSRSAIIDCTGFSGHGLNITGNYVKLDGFRFNNHTFENASYGVVNIAGSYCTVTDCYVNGSKSVGIRAVGSNNTISDNYITDIPYGFDIHGADNLIEDNEVENLHQYTGDADYSRVFGSNHIMRGNLFHGTHTITDAHVDCVQSFDVNGEHLYDLLYEKNWCENASQVFMLEAQKYDLSDGVIVRNNVFKNLGSWFIDSKGVDNVWAYNNTLIDGAAGFACRSGTAYENEFEAVGCQCYNNLFHTFTNVSLCWSSGELSTMDRGYNLLYSSGVTHTGDATDLLNIEPTFVDFDGSDYRLALGSRGINEGTAIDGWSSPADYNDVSRPQGAAWDIGAYEYASGDETDPEVIITTPTSSTTYSTSYATFRLGGTASDATGVTSVAYSVDTGDSGSCTGTTAWVCSGIALVRGANVVTVTASDAASNEGTDSITVTYVLKRTLFR